MDEKEYLTPDTKSFDEQYGQMMREQLEQLRREKSQENSQEETDATEDTADAAENTPYEEIGESFDEGETHFEVDAHDRDIDPWAEDYLQDEPFREENFNRDEFDQGDSEETLPKGDEEEPDGEDEYEYDEYIEEEEDVPAEEEATPEEADQEEDAPVRPRKRRRKRHGCAIIIYSFLAIIALIIIANTPLFAVQKIHVKGNKDYTKKQVIAMSGVKKGDNLFRIHKRSIRKRLVDSSYIRDVNLTRTLPDTITITVKERQAMAYLPYGSKNIVIDVNGFVLKVVNKKPKLVKIADMSIKSMEVGKPVAVSNEGKLKESLEILKLMKQGNVFFKEIKPGTVVMELCVYDRLLCKGTKNNLAAAIKNETLQGIISDLYKKNVNKGTVNVGHGEYISFSPKANP